MVSVSILLAGVLLAAMLWPDLPFSKSTVSVCIKVIRYAGTNHARTRALLAITAALLIFAAIWALAGDASMFLTMALPELAAWFTTFEIATLTEALLGLGTAFIALRAAGLGSYIKGRVRARRSRRVSTRSGKAANDDEPGGWALAA